MISASRVLRASADVVVLACACLTLATCGGGGDDGGTGTGAPAIALSDQTIDFIGPVGGASPNSQSVAITNNGGGALGGLTSNVTYGASEPTGWLTASLDHSAAPATLTLSSTTGVLSTGVYHASVEIASSVASNSPRHVEVTFSVMTGIPTPPPAAPTALAATAASSSQINLTWTDNATNESGFRLERCAGAACTGFAEYALVGPNVTSYSDGSLAASTTYRYRVRAYNDVDNSAYTNTASATTLAVPVAVPSAPTSLTATAASSSQINLAWTDNASNETGFRIERCTGLSCVDFVEITTVAANVTTYQNTALATSTGYSYRVRAYNATGNSGYSNTQSATTLGTGPAAPTVLTATAASSSQINLSWTDNASNETGFLIERCTGAGCVNFVEFASTVTNVTTYQNTGLAASTVYTYRVRAWNATATSAYSNSASATTSAPAVAPPAAPTNMTANVLSTSVIDLSWTDNASTETGFSVEGCTGASCTNFTEIGTFGANVTLINANSLTAGTTYRFRVRAYNTGGYSAYSNIVSPTTMSEATLLATFDNLIAKSSADAQVQNTVYQTAENSVGNNYYYTGSTLTNMLQTASLMKFDQTPIAGKTIVEARLLLVERTAPGDLFGTFKIASMASFWNPAAMTWTAFESPSTTWWTDDAVSFGASSTTTVSARSFDITAIVQKWASGARTNYGLIIYDDLPQLTPYASYQQMTFWSLENYNALSSRPQLYIRYR